MSNIIFLPIIHQKHNKLVRILNGNIEGSNIINITIDLNQKRIYEQNMKNTTDKDTMGIFSN